MTLSIQFGCVQRWSRGYQEKSGGAGQVGGPEQQADASASVRETDQRIAGIGKGGRIGAAQKRIQRGGNQPALSLDAAQQ